MYFYLNGPKGERYCWAKQPSFECPIGSTTDLGDILAMAADEIGVTQKFMLARLKHSPVRERDSRERFTGNCGTCGHKLTRLGFEIWVESTEPPPLDDTYARTVYRLSGAWRTAGPWYKTTKRDAEEWARARKKAER